MLSHCNIEKNKAAYTPPTSRAGERVGRSGLAKTNTASSRVTSPQAYRNYQGLCSREGEGQSDGTAVVKMRMMEAIYFSNSSSI